jgi:aspartyl-tRNA(Asn)/glutamyl-tRNA(Gln) amidotransferase subunit C
MKISQEEVEHVARLARLSLTGEELERMTEQLDTILSYFAKLQELDTSEIEPTFHVFSLTNAFREDLVQPSLTQAEALSNGPLHNGQTFLVPRIL